MLLLKRRVGSILHLKHNEKFEQRNSFFINFTSKIELKTEKDARHQEIKVQVRHSIVDRQDEFGSTSGAAVNPGQEVIMNNFSLSAKTRWQTRRRFCISFFLSSTF